MEKNNAPQVPATVPVMTIERFSELTGMSYSAIKGQLQLGNRPLFKIGRRRMVNIALLTAECLQSEDWA